MSINIEAKNGLINISDEVVSSVVGASVISVFGVVGMTSKNVKESISKVLNQENYSTGITISRENEELIIDIFTILSYGVKISEVSHNIQETVKYQLQEILGVEAKQINVHVKSIQ